jgi:hypothetical protein
MGLYGTLDKRDSLPFIKQSAVEFKRNFRVPEYPVALL